MKLRTIPKNIARHAAIKVLITLAVERGAGVFLVGGTVRDLLLGRAIQDIDVVVTGVPYKPLGDFLAKHGTANAAGNFGTVKFLAEGEHQAIDVALPRTERSVKPGTRTGFAVEFDETLPIQDDLARRDFTVNAIALNLVTKEIVDPYDGRKDLAARIIRTVGNPEDRFAEDSTRILRAFRFACTLDATIDFSTRKVMKSLALTLSGRAVPKEMKAQELTKALVGNPAVFMDLLVETGIGKALLPEILALRGVREGYGDVDVFTHTKATLAVSQSSRYAKTFGEQECDATILLALLLHDLGKPQKRVVRRTAGGQRVTFNGHAEKSADLAQVVWERLNLSQGGGKRSSVLSAIAHHSVLSRGALKTIRDRTLDRYFLAHPDQGMALKKLLFCDWEVGDPEARIERRRQFRILEKRLTEIEARAYKDGKPKQLITGEDITRAFHIPPGERLGRLLGEIRMRQIEGTLTTPEEAKDYLRRRLNHA